MRGKNGIFLGDLKGFFKDFERILKGMRIPSAAPPQRGKDAPCSELRGKKIGNCRCREEQKKPRKTIKKCGKTNGKNNINPPKRVFCHRFGKIWENPAGGAEGKGKGGGRTPGKATPGKATPG